MITINGRKFARNESELVSSLFDPSGTGSGFYRPIRGGIQLYNLQNELFALAVNNKHGEQFFVSAHLIDGKARYLYTLTDKDSALLGLDALTYRQQCEAAKVLFSCVTHVMPVNSGGYSGNNSQSINEGKRMNESVKAFLSDAGYSDKQIAQGFEYAESVGYSNDDELGQLALSRILYTDAQLTAGDLAPWEPALT